MGGYLIAIGSTGKRSAAHQNWVALQQEEVGVTRCQLCAEAGAHWEFVGSFALGREMLAGHRATWHPEFVPVRRNRRMVGVPKEEIEV